MKKFMYLHYGVPDWNHVLGEILDEGKETPLGVEPGVRSQLLVVRLKRLDHPRDAELIVALRTVKRAWKKLG